MAKLEYATSFRDLLVYQKAKELSRTIFKITKRFPKEEAYSLTDQIRRSSRSIGAQIAEAWAKRRYEKHFVSKLTDADGEHRKLSIGSKLHLIVNIFLKNRKKFFWRNVLKSVDCLAG